MFMPAAVVLDMLRIVCLGRTEETALRRLVEKARVAATNATITARVFVVRRAVDGGIDCCCVVVVFDIEIEESL